MHAPAVACWVTCICLCFRALDSLKVEGRTSHSWSKISLDEVLKCLEDLIEYFAQPADETGMIIKEKSDHCGGLVVDRV